MSFRRIMLSMLTIWLALMGITFGALFILCVCLYLFWYGLSLSVIIFGLLSLTFIALAYLAVRHATLKDKIT